MNLFPNLKKKLLYHRYILNQWVTSSSDWRALPQGVLSRSSVYWNGPSTRRPIGWSFLSNPFIMILTTIKESWRKFGDSLKVNVSLYVGFLLLGTTALFLDFTFWPHEKYTTLTYVLYLSVTINVKTQFITIKALISCNQNYLNYSTLQPFPWNNVYICSLCANKEWVNEWMITIIEIWYFFQLFLKVKMVRYNKVNTHPTGALCDNYSK